MSKYDEKYLTENVRVGFVESKGPAWWATQGENQSGHYPGAIPWEDALEFFGWEPVKVALHGPNGEPLLAYDGKAPVAITNGRTGQLIGVMGDSYPVTSYRERLLDGLSSILDTPGDELGIGSLGILDGGSQGWCQIETPETITHSSGEQFKPWLCGYTSLDGSLKTTFKEGTTRVVCDNTFDAFRSKFDRGNTYSYKNTANSSLKVATAREALDLLHKVAENYMAELDVMLDRKVSDVQWESILELAHPIEGLEDGRKKTTRENRRLELSGLYYHDPRVAPFSGTAWGAFHAFSTYNQHESTVQEGDNEFQRNMRKNMAGTTFAFDESVMTNIDKVLATA